MRALLAMWCAALCAALFAVGVGAGDASADSAGKTGASGMGGLLCTDCHGGGKAPTVKLTGAESVMAGSTSTYTIIITSATPKGQKFGGVDVATSGGTLQAMQADTKVSGGELVHSKILGPGDPIQVQFQLLAPSQAGTITLFSDVLSSDGSNSPAGDNSATAKLAVQVVVPPDLAMPRPDFAGLDLLGIDLAEPPPPPDLAMPVDLAFVQPPDFATAPPPKKDEPRWGCGCRVGPPGGGRSATMAVLLFALVFALRRRTS
ncbi:MAG: hypothetical protein EXR72_01365 [Myxococcales bacterium]|nr:hypothetical protein [Myxococcales bacterium]